MAMPDANQCIAFISVFRLLDDSSDLDVAFVGRPVPRAQISEMTNPMSFAMANANEQVMQLFIGGATHSALTQQLQNCGFSTLTLILRSTVVQYQYMYSSQHMRSR